MNADKFTQKTIETIQTAQSMAQENGNQYLTPEHLLYALVDADGGLIGTLLGRMGVDCNAVLSELDTAIDQLPKVSGGSGEVYASPETSKIFNFAEREAKSGGDAYVSVEHLMLGIFANNMIMVFVALVLFYVPGTLIQMTAILPLTDSIEYGQLKNGKRNEAVTLSVRPMLDKIGGAMSNGIVGIIAVAAGMTGNATAADMTASNIHIFKICAFYIPLVLIILSLIVFLFKVKITEKMHDEIVKELEVKLANGEIEADDAQTVEAVEAVAVAETAGTAGTATPAGQPESR